jgi:hypothetical protein
MKHLLACRTLIGHILSLSTSSSTAGGRIWSCRSSSGSPSQVIPTTTLHLSLISTTLVWWMHPINKISSTPTFTGSECGEKRRQQRGITPSRQDAV